MRGRETRKIYAHFRDQRFGKKLEVSDRTAFQSPRQTPCTGYGEVSSIQVLDRTSSGFSDKKDVTEQKHKSKHTTVRRKTIVVLSILDHNRIDVCMCATKAQCSYPLFKISKTKLYQILNGLSFWQLRDPQAFRMKVCFGRIQNLHLYVITDSRT
ncbi:MAG TPA: hypothetical protein DD706_03165 [Nitrospiraceae bacterium]|nr:hypothetical protein [Nitrospiraceae bacterium]